jgi:hypothetical protein
LSAWKEDRNRGNAAFLRIGGFIRGRLGYYLKSFLLLVEKEALIKKSKTILIVC